LPLFVLRDAILIFPLCGQLSWQRYAGLPRYAFAMKCAFGATMNDAMPLNAVHVAVPVRVLWRLAATACDVLRIDLLHTLFQRAFWLLQPSGPFSAAAMEPRRAVLCSVRLRSPAVATWLHVFLRGRVQFPHEQILLPLSMEISLPSNLLRLVLWFLVLASTNPPLLRDACF